jgi:hypothetical protein
MVSVVRSLLMRRTVERNDKRDAASNDPCFDFGNIGGERSVIDDALDCFGGCGSHGGNCLVIPSRFHVDGVVVK